MVKRLLFFETKINIAEPGTFYDDLYHDGVHDEFITIVSSNRQEVIEFKCSRYEGCEAFLKKITEVKNTIFL